MTDHFHNTRDTTMPYRANGYMDAVKGTTQWDYRRDVRIVPWYQRESIHIPNNIPGIRSGRYQTLRSSLREALVTGDYSIFERTVHIFRTYLGGVTRSGNPINDSTIPKDKNPGDWIMSYAFEDLRVLSSISLKEAIGNIWLHTLGPLSFDNEPDLIVMPTSEPFSADDPPEPGEVVLRWGGDTLNTWGEVTHDPESLATEICLNAYGGGSYLPIINDVCGGTFTEWITYLIFPGVHVYDPDPVASFRYLAPTIRDLLGVPDQPFRPTINRHFS